jgi:hypothetical protein
MAAAWQRRVLGLVVLTAALTSGCDPMASAYFLFGPEPKIEPLLKQVASKDKDVKVVVLTYTNDLTMRPEVMKADRDIAKLTCMFLKKGFEYNKEKVTVVPAIKVEDFKKNHPDWHTMDRAEIGRHFEADYVIYLEIAAVSLYEQRSSNQLYRGQADITISLIDVNNPDEEMEQREFSCTYPGEGRGPVPVEDKSLAAFKLEFFGTVATKLSWHFTSHPTDEDYKFEN